MTVDIAHANGNAIAVLGGANEALARLGEWVQAASHAHALVAPLVGTAFVPDAYKPKIHERSTEKEKAEAREVAIANATAAVLQGITLGLDPMTSLQQIYIVHGRPGMYTEIKVALVKSRGHEVWTEDISDSRAVVCGRRRGTEFVERVTVTMDQARRAGWTKNEAYGKTPQDMLYARAAGRVCDRIAPDVLMGIASVEEIQDTIKATAEVGDGTRTVTPRKRGPAAAVTATATAVEEPPLDEEPATSRPAAAASAPEPEPDLDRGEESKPPSITRAQTAKMKTLFADAGITDREAMRDYCTQQLGRVVSSVSELSRDDADKVIEALTPAEEPPATLDDEAWLADQQPPLDPPATKAGRDA